MDAAVAAELSRLGSATVHEAAGRSGALPSSIKPVDPSWRVCAPAYPVSTPAGNNLALHQALYATPPGAILVVATGAYDDGVEWGYWGEILNAAAIEVGLAGLVIDGGVRDVSPLRAASFPVFARAVSILGTAKSGDGSTLGMPIRIGDVTVAAGDVVVGDADGVVVVAADSVATVAAAAVDRERHEQDILRRLSAGERTLDIYRFIS